MEYSVSIGVKIDGASIIFEPDEERNWGAVIGLEDLTAGKNVKRELLETVAAVIGEITK